MAKARKLKWASNDLIFYAWCNK